jgi:1,4-dihydroxy-2-naphthoyl-CoA synthase
MQSLKMFYNTAESKEGVAAFLEKRPPQFRGARKLA